MKLLEEMRQRSYIRCMHIASPTDEIIKPPAPKAFVITLRDGRHFVIGGMSASQLKFLRKNGGNLSLKNTQDGAEVNVSGKMIKKIEPFTPPPHGKSDAK